MGDRERGAAACGREVDVNISAGSYGTALAFASDDGWHMVLIVLIVPIVLESNSTNSTNSTAEVHICFLRPLTCCPSIKIPRYSSTKICF